MGFLILGALVALNLQGGASQEDDLAAPPTEAALVIGGGEDWLNPPQALNDFQLSQADGEVFQLSAQEGKTLLIYFGYLTCPDICPTGMTTLQRAYLELGEDREHYEVIFVTVDPERDTPDRLARYTGAFHEDFLGLYTQDEAAMQAVMQAFGVVARRREVDSSLGYLVDHTAAIFIVNGQGVLQARMGHDVDFRRLAEAARQVQEG
jgi:protein SCO1/2